MDSRAVLPGIESWFELGGKSRTGALQGMDKVRQVAEHVNLILKYIPYIQTNFVMIVDVVLAKIFGTKTEREIKACKPTVAAINDLEPAMRA
jgi:hypothetical protein